MNMKPIDKLNEDFFDDFNDNDLIDEPVDDSFGEPIDNTDYTYHFQFAIFMDPFEKPSFTSDDPEYIFDEPKYEHKLTIEHGFLSMKKLLYEKMHEFLKYLPHLIES